MAGVASCPEGRLRARGTNRVAPAEKPYRGGPISGTFRSDLVPAFRRGGGGGRRHASRVVQAVYGGGTWTRRWSGAGRGCGSHAPGFRARVATLRLRGLRPTKPTKEPHDSIVPVLQWRRAKPVPAPRAHSSAWPRGPPLPSPRDCFGPLPNGLGPRNDGRGFLPTVTDPVRESTRNDVAWRGRTALPW